MRDWDVTWIQVNPCDIIVFKLYLSVLALFVAYLGGKRYGPGGNLFWQQQHSMVTAEWECLIN